MGRRKPACNHVFGEDDRCTGCGNTRKRLEALKAGTAAAQAKAAARRAQRAGVDLSGTAEAPAGRAVTDPDVVITPYPADKPQPVQQAAGPVQTGQDKPAEPVTGSTTGHGPAPVTQAPTTRPSNPSLLGGLAQFLKDGIGWTS